MISSLELARLCGVSQGTVDRALHNRPGISEATRARILAMAEQHGHLPNPAARELMGHRAPTMVTALVSDSNLRAPFFLDLFAAASRALRDEGLTLNLALVGDDPGLLAAAAAETVARRIRALVLIMPPADLALAPPVIAAQPVFSFLLPCPIPGVRNLLPDERAIGRRATDHLLALGHRRIAHVHHPVDHWAIREREAGYREAMAEAGSTALVIPTGHTENTVTKIMESGVTAVFCHHDPLALALMRRLRAAGRNVPGDLSVIGVDASPIMHAIDPSLTSVTYPFNGLSAQLVAALHGRPLPPLPRPGIHEGLTCSQR